MASTLAFASLLHVHGIDSGLWSANQAVAFPTATMSTTARPWGFASRPRSIVQISPSSRRRSTTPTPSRRLRRGITTMRHDDRWKRISQWRPFSVRDRHRRQADPATAPEVARVEPAQQGFSVPLILLPAVCLRPSVEATDSAARALLEVGSSVPGGWGFSFFQGVIRTEAFVSGVILLAAPLVMRSWAKIEADHHDTLECRTVLQTYLIAAAGCLCSMSASVAGNPILAVVMQAAWRGAAARSLWTWSDLGRRLTDTPGWLHSSVARWRILATYAAVAGAAVRALVLIAAGGGFPGAACGLSNPLRDILPAWFVRVASRPDPSFRLSSAQLGFGLGLYAWISYYVCAFLPYRILSDEYQDSSRRVKQFCKDLEDVSGSNVELATKIGPGFPKHIARRMAKMPAGKERNLLRAVGIVRERAGSITVAKVAMMKKNKRGKYGVKMVPLKLGDHRFWGSSIFERLEQQEAHDKATGWKEPMGWGTPAYNRMIYSKIMREIKVELGKTDEEMETDPSLSLANLMHFDPEAEEGDFELIKQKSGMYDPARTKTRIEADGHQMVITDDSTPADRAKEAGLPSQPGEGLAVASDLEDGSGNISDADSFLYNKDSTAGSALEDSIRSRMSKKPTTPEGEDKKDLREKKGAAKDAEPAPTRTSQ